MRSRAWLWLVLIVLLVLVLSCASCATLGLLTLGQPGGVTPFARPVGDAIAVIEVKGAILTGKTPPGLGSTAIVYSERVIQDLWAAIADPSVKAIILDVNSPGGSVVGTTDIHRALVECPKPVITSMGEVAASGGYYIACATQYVLARPATTTGSIGVRWQFINAETLLRKLGVEVQIIKSGLHKDQGGWHRPLSPEEMAMYQAIVDQAYETFVQIVARGRNLDAEKVRGLADGRVFTGRQALALGLVDAEGNLDDAIQVAAQMAGIRGRPRLVRFEARPGLFDLLWGFASGLKRPTELALLEELLGARETPKLQYLYTGP